MSASRARANQKCSPQRHPRSWGFELSQLQFRRPRLQTWCAVDLFLIYVVCFGAGLCFTIISALIADVAGGHDFAGHDAHADLGTGGHAEAGADHGSMPGFSPFSPTTVAAFVTAFGGLGMIFSKIDATSNPWISTPLAGVGGLAIAAGIFWLFQQIFHRTQSSSESRIGTVIGLAANIITPIPVGGVGEIAYVHRGTRYTAPARSYDGKAIGFGDTVVITRVHGSDFIVTNV